MYPTTTDSPRTLGAAFAAPRPSRLDAAARRTKTLTKILSLTLATAALGGGMAASANASSPSVGASGDFNGDGTADIASFTRGQAADAFVALSDGSRFGVPSKWHDLFAYGTSIPLAGDFNGDGLDDVASFSRGIYGQVHVAASIGSKFVNTGGPWISGFALGHSIPQVGDFNCDGRDDIASFTGDEMVFVALSTGSAFSAPNAHGPYGGHDRTPIVGKLTSAPCDTIAYADTNSDTIRIVMLDHDEGSVERTWGHVPRGEDVVLAVGNVDDDDTADIVYTRGTQILASRSTGSSFGAVQKWHDNFAPGSETSAPGSGA